MGDKKKCNVAYLQTPFQVRVFTDFIEYKGEVSKYPWVIYYDSRVQQMVLELFGDKELNCVMLDSKRNMSIKQRMKNALDIRKGIATYRKELSDLAIQDFVFFSEKTVFTQLVLSVIDHRTSVWSIDEGTGHYAYPNKYDYLTKLIYPFISYVLFGFGYQFYRVLGTHPRINNLILRAPFLRPRSLPSPPSILTFKDLGLLADSSKPIDHEKVSKSKKVLLLTTVLYTTTDSNISAEEEQRIFGMLLSAFKSKGYEVHVKPHPRENIEDKYKHYINDDSLYFFPKNVSGEDIEYVEYAYIILNYSSLIIDILGKKYPLNRVWALNFSVRANIDHLFQDTIYIREPDQLEKYAFDIK